MFPERFLRKFFDGARVDAWRLGIKRAWCGLRGHPAWTRGRSHVKGESAGLPTIACRRCGHAKPSPVEHGWGLDANGPAATEFAEIGVMRALLAGQRCVTRVDTGGLRANSPGEWFVFRAGPGCTPGCTNDTPHAVGSGCVLAARVIAEPAKAVL